MASYARKLANLRRNVRWQKMIDRESRDILAESFRHLIAGQISNDQFEDRLRKSEDAGVNEVFFCGA